MLHRVEGIPELERGLYLEVKTDNTLFLSQTVPLCRPRWLVQKAEMVISASGQMWGPSEDVSWVFFGRNDAKAETPILWPPHAKS